MRWLAAVPVPLGTSLVSEGHSLVPVAGAGALVSFGGYNDRYHNSVFVLRPVFGSMSAPVVAAPSPAPAPVDTAVSGTAARQGRCALGACHGAVPLPSASGGRWALHRHGSLTMGARGCGG